MVHRHAKEAGQELVNVQYWQMYGLWSYDEPEDLCELQERWAEDDNDSQNEDARKWVEAKGNITYL